MPQQSARPSTWILALGMAVVPSFAQTFTVLAVNDPHIARNLASDSGSVTAESGGMVYKLYPQQLNVLHGLRSGQQLIAHPIPVGAKSVTVKITANWRTHSDSGNFSIDLDDEHGRRKAFIFVAQEIESMEVLRERSKQEEALRHPPDITNGCITVSKILADVGAVLATVYNKCDSPKTVSLTYGGFLQGNVQSQSD